MDDFILISPRFCGPKDSGNGGYVCGKLAGFLSGAVQVRLKAPPPLNRPLRVERFGEDQVRLWDEERLVAEAQSLPLELEVPKAPTWEQAQAAEKNYLGLRHHLYPECFVCGPRRPTQDGLHIFPGPLADREVVAATWSPDANLVGTSTTTIPKEFLWAALDCPGAFAFMKDDFPKILLGTLHAEVLHEVTVGEKCWVIGWTIKQEGRKQIVGTAVFSQDQGLVARARGIWIELKQES